MLKKLFTIHIQPVHCLNWWNKHCVFSQAEQVPSIWIRVRQRLHKLSRHLKAYLACISAALVLNIPEQCERPRGLPHMNRNIENATKPEPPPSFLWSHFARRGVADDGALLLIQCCSSTSTLLLLLFLLHCTFSARLLLNSVLLYFPPMILFCTSVLAQCTISAVMLVHIQNHKCVCM